MLSAKPRKQLRARYRLNTPKTLRDPKGRCPCPGSLGPRRDTDCWARSAISKDSSSGEKSISTSCFALSGGITDTASGEITIARPADLNCFTNIGMRTTANLSGSVNYLSGIQRRSGTDPVILSGDIITVIEASPILYNRRREQSKTNIVTRGNDLSRAISSAGGLAKEAVESDITVYRREGKDRQKHKRRLKKIKVQTAGRHSFKAIRHYRRRTKGKSKA